MNWEDVDTKHARVRPCKEPILTIRKGRENRIYLSAGVSVEFERYSLAKSGGLMGLIPNPDGQLKISRTKKGNYAYIQSKGASLAIREFFGFENEEAVRLPVGYDNSVIVIKEAAHE